jgi:hypothetical protein
LAESERAEEKEEAFHGKSETVDVDNQRAVFRDSVQAYFETGGVKRRGGEMGKTSNVQRSTLNVQGDGETDLKFFT